VGLRFFRKHRAGTAPAARPEGREELRRSVSRAVVVDGSGAAPDPAAAAAEAREALRRIVAEALLIQDLAEDILDGVRAGRPLGELSRAGAALAARFAELRGALPETADAEVRRHCDVVARVLDHHAMMVSASLDLLAVDWRSERVTEHLERVDGLGAPAQWLRAVGAELGASRAPVPAAGPGTPA
jgi:hypothetical protein